MPRKDLLGRELTQEDISRFEEAFSSVDKKNTKEIDLNGIYDALEIAQEKFHEDDIIDAIETIGKTEFDKFNFDDFIQIIVEANNPENIITAFSFFDKDKNGYITVDEFKSVLRMVGSDLTDAQLNDIFKISGVSKDGKIAYEEFVKFWNDQ